MSVYVLKEIGGNRYRHCDPINGEHWGPKDGAFEFSSVEEAIKFGPYYTGNKPFQVVEIEEG